MAGRPLIERLEMCSDERLGFEGCKDSVSCRQSVWPPKVIAVCDILAPEAANNPRGNIFVAVVKKKIPVDSCPGRLRVKLR